MTTSADALERTPPGGTPDPIDSPDDSAGHRRWLPTVTEAGITLAVGLAALLIFRWRAGIGALDTSSPILYDGDTFVFGNDVINGQLGNLFLGHTLGAPLGQQMGLSAYGVEWFQWWIAGHLAPLNESGPWLAIVRYWQLTYFVAGATAYLALRWTSVRRSAAVIGGLAFALVPTHQLYYSSFDLVPIGVLPLVLALSFLLASGSSFADLVPSSWTLFEHHRKKCGLVLVALVTLLALGANYYMIFNLFILSSAAVVMLVRREWWPRARRLGVAAAFALVPMAISYGPIIVARLLAGLSLSEDATSDRRPFAAYANGGDPFGLLTPHRNGFVMTALTKIPVVNGFFEEYSIDNTTKYEYGTIVAGTVVVSALLILGLVALGSHRRTDFLKRSAPLSAILKAVCLVGLLSVLWFTRGGLGTFMSFVFPQIRGYARAGMLVVFCAIALLGLAATAHQFFSKKIRILAFVLLSIGLIESVTGTTQVIQVNPNALAIDSPIQRSEVFFPQSGFGASIKIPGPQGTKNLLAAADRSLPAGCTVLVLPLVKYPVDFDIGVVSYRSYALVLPGLMPTKLRWTSGGFTGTPNNAFVDKWLGPYREGDVSSVLEAADQAGYCGALFFDSMHEAFHWAGVLNGSKYVTPSNDVTVALLKHYGEPCYAAHDAGVELFCRTDSQSK